MLTLSRRVGQRILIGEVTVEVVSTTRGGVTLRLLGIQDESAVSTASDLEDQQHAPRRRTIPRRGGAPPLIVEVRRSARRS